MPPSSGIVKKWADKYGINIEVKQFNDYVESINQFTAGAFDAVTITNMDALSIPAAGGVDTTAIIVGDFSNGNDAVILKDKKELKDILGQKVNLVEFSVSHYLLARALESIKAQEKDLKVVNTSDADMAAAFKTPDVTAVVTWKPIVSTILESPDAKNRVRQFEDPRRDHRSHGGQHRGAEGQPEIRQGACRHLVRNARHDEVRATRPRNRWPRLPAPTSRASKSSSPRRKLFSDPKDAVAFTNGGDLKTTTERVSKFLFEKSLLGKDAKTEGAVGVEFPDKTVFGDKGNVKFRYDATFMNEAAEGKLQASAQ